MGIVYILVIEFSQPGNIRYVKEGRSIMFT